jgi:hypothetical protein
VDGNKRRLVFDQAALFSCPVRCARRPVLLDTGRQSAERNKTSVILLRSLGPKKNGPWCGPSEPLRCPLATFGGFGPVLTLNKIMVLCRSAGAFTCLSTSSYIMRARLSSLFPSGRCAPPPAFGRQPLVCHGVNQGHFDAAVVQRPPYSVDISVPLKQLHRVNLPAAMGRGVHG